jgi:hypothetical protein
VLDFHSSTCLTVVLDANFVCWPQDMMDCDFGGDPTIQFKERLLTLLLLVVSESLGSGEEQQSRNERILGGCNMRRDQAGGHCLFEVRKRPMRDANSAAAIK